MGSCQKDAGTRSKWLSLAEFETVWTSKWMRMKISLQWFSKRKIEEEEQKAPYRKLVANKCVRNYTSRKSSSQNKNWFRQKLLMNAKTIGKLDIYFQIIILEITYQLQWEKIFLNAYIWWYLQWSNLALWTMK